MKLVLVDNDKHFRNDLKFFLEKKLIHTIIVEKSNGEEFLAIDNCNEVDDILVDHFQDQSVDIGFAKHIKSKCHQLRVIAITMNTGNESLKKEIDTGFKGLIFKSEFFNSLKAVLQ